MIVELTVTRFLEYSYIAVLIGCEFKTTAYVKIERELRVENVCGIEVCMKSKTIELKCVISHLEVVSCVEFHASGESIWLSFTWRWPETIPVHMVQVAYDIRSQTKCPLASQETFVWRQATISKFIMNTGIRILSCTGVMRSISTPNTDTERETRKDFKITIP